MEKLLNFRALNADEVEARVQQAKQNGVVLLLYKDARVDQRLLDETVGPLNWQRSHELIDGQLFCNVAIRTSREGNFGEWVVKQDVGTESNTEAEKGRASDAFKRACFNWGIGRELYTAPFIWVPANECNIERVGNIYKCYDRFSVTQMDVQDGRIVSLAIRNDKTKKTCYTWGNARNATAEPQNAPRQTVTQPSQQMPTGPQPGDEQRNQQMVQNAENALVTEPQIITMNKLAGEIGVPTFAILSRYGLNDVHEMTVKVWNTVMRTLTKQKEAQRAGA